MPIPFATEDRDVTMAVFPMLRLVNGVLMEVRSVPKRSYYKLGDIVSLFTSLRRRGDDGPQWSVEIRLSDKVNAQKIVMPIEPILTAAEYSESFQQPWCFANLLPDVPGPSDDEERQAGLRWLWLYRDVLHVTEWPPAETDVEEVVLRIKAWHFERSESLKRLRDRIGNLESVERHLAKPDTRPTIPDDVKLLVWARDNGVCVRCGSERDLQFDHVIPFSRGGHSDAENLQILCKPCNLAKGDRIV